MSITKSLYTGVSGLNAHSRAMGVVGDNIANLNTNGYKTQRAVFSDLLGRSILGKDQPGSGVQMNHIENTFAQGSLMTTESPTDLAINGEGFFVLRGETGSASGSFYSRAGQFAIDNSGNLINPDGFIVQGYLVNDTGDIDSQLTDLQIAGNDLPPEATSEVGIIANLDATEGTPATSPFDPTNPGGTSNFSTGVTVHDSLGNAHNVGVYFVKSAENTWTWHAVADGGEIGGTAGVNEEVASGTLTFDTNGDLSSQVTTTAWADTFNGAAPQTIAFDFGAGQAGGTTQYAATSSIRSQEQDGNSSGELVGVGVEGNGEVMAMYSNGEQQVAGQVAVATFEAEGSLARAGGTLWAQTDASGEALVGAPGSGSSGSISANALEQSTVDLALEFVNLISYQRGFQANSRTITTADAIYQEAVNLKR